MEYFRAIVAQASVSELELAVRSLTQQQTTQFVAWITLAMLVLTAAPLAMGAVLWLGRALLLATSERFRAYYIRQIARARVARHAMQSEEHKLVDEEVAKIAKEPGWRLWVLPPCSHSQ